MVGKLKILLVEDSKDDALLLLRELKKGGFQPQPTRVETRASLVSALKKNWDIIIADYVLPEFSGLEALKLAKGKKPDLPFIMISGKREEEVVVESLKAGAQDYVMKDRLFRLCPAVAQALKYRDAHLEKINAEKELQRVVSRYHLLAENITDVIWTADPDWKFTFISPSVTVALGYRSEDLIGKRLDSIIDVLDLQKIKDVIETDLLLLKDHKKLPAQVKEVFDMKFHKKEGQSVWMETKMAILSGEKRGHLGFLGVSRDITRRKRRDEEIILLAQAFRQISEGVVITDQKGIIKYVNESFEMNCGFSRNKIIGKSLGILDSGPRPNHAPQSLLTALRKGRSWKGQVKRDRKDNSSYMAEVSLYPIRGEEERVTNFVYVERDITRELELQDKFIAMQKMEALGTLAGGIAHDFNNILMPIIVNSEMLLWDSGKNDPQNVYLNQILEAGKRGKELVKQIISFSRESSVKKNTIDLVALVKESLSFLHSSLPSTIKIDTQIKIEEGRIEGNTGQIQQVLTNLCTNAADALGDKGGKIEICLVRTDFESEEMLPDPRLKTGPFVRLSVSDSGPGIEPDVMAKIFDPFFTTKGPARGSGMGLPVAQRIVIDHRGVLTVESEPDKGATFNVYLPLSDGSLPPEEEMVSTLPGGSERILLVDDEAPLVDSIRNMLQKRGYRVTALTSSEEALDIFKAQPDAVDLVITDQIMPNLSGATLAREIARIRPDVPLILMTGFSAEISENDAKSIGINEYLMKPVSAEAMATTIRKVLDGKK